MYDFEGMENQPIEFTVTSHSNKTLNYTLKIENDIEKQNNCVIEGTNDPCPPLSTNYIKASYKIGDNDWSEPINLGSNSNIVLTDTISKNNDKDISIKIWIDSTAPNEIQGTYFYGKLILEATKN